MDPLSITTSVLTLVAVAKELSNGLNRLASLPAAFESIIALNNEVSDFLLLLTDVEAALTDYDMRNDRQLLKASLASNSKRVMPYLQTTWDLFYECGKIIERLNARIVGIKRVTMLWEQDNISKAQKGLRDARSSLVGILGLLTCKSTFRVETQLQEVQSLTMETNAYVSQSINQQKEFFQQIVERQRKHETHHLKEQERAVEHDHGNSADNKLQLIKGRRYSDSPGQLFGAAHFSALRMRFLRRRKCHPWCACRCHTHNRLQTPQLFERVIGQLFVGYTGFPSLTGACDLHDTCQGTAQSFIQINYYFPSWFLTRVVTFSLRTSEFDKPEYSLRILNVRNKFEPIFVGAGSNDAALVRSLISNHKASVLDVTDGDGHSALHLAVKQSNVDATKALLEMGAEPYLENATQETPYDMAWSTILCFQDTPNAAAWRVEEMKALFPSLDSVEERRKFTKIHKIVNKILYCDLEKELCRSRALINQVDADGRTALSYAAARGDHAAVDTLLRYGADPNIADRIGQGPLRQSMKAFDSTCTMLLLRAGAKVDHRDNWEQTALISALFHPRPLPFVATLLNFGADVNVVDYQGSSPLMEAVKSDASEAIRLLIHHGADVNVVDYAGMSTLIQAIRHNSHAALEALLQPDTQVIHSVCDNDQKTLLHWAAEMGDIKTLQILAKTPLRGLSIQDRSKTGLTAIDIAEKRLAMENLIPEKAPKGSEWLVAFRELLEAIRVPTANQSPKSMSEKTDDSNDAFQDALQSLTFEELEDLAEQGCVPQRV